MALDHDMLVRLLIRERVKLIGYIRAIVGDEHAAEDVFQQVSVLVLRKGGEVNDAEHFLAWMRTASRLEALNVMRARRRSPLALSDSVAELLDPHWQRYDAVESGVMIEALRGCLGELTPNSRQLIEMRYREAMSSGQIAEQLSRKATAVYRRSRGRIRRWPSASGGGWRRATMREAQTAQFVDLAVAFLEGRADAEQVASLNAALQVNAERRDLFVRLSLTPGLIGEAMSEAAAEPTRRITPTGPTATSGLSRWRYAWAAGLLVAMGIVAAYVAVLTTGGESTDTPAERSVGVLLAASDVRWASDPIEEGDSVRRQTMAIDDGVLRMELLGGASLTLTGPTTLGVIDKRHVRLDRGHLTAHASQPGFTVDLPGGAKLVDLSTAFHVWVDDAGRSHAVVLEGTVRLDGATAADTHELTVGMRATVEPDGSIIRTDPSTDHVAYRVESGTQGNQPFAGALGMDFAIDRPVLVTHLGVFDSGGDGLKRPITVTLYKRLDAGTPDEPGDDTGLAIATRTITGVDAELIGGTRFIALDEPLLLPAGFGGTIVAAGYGDGEPVGNLNAGIGRRWSTDAADGAIRFVGRSRWSDRTDAIPAHIDTGPADRYAAGSIRYRVVDEHETSAHQSTPEEHGP